MFCLNLLSRFYQRMPMFLSVRCLRTRKHMRTKEMVYFKLQLSDQRISKKHLDQSLFVRGTFYVASGHVMVLPKKY